MTKDLSGLVNDTGAFDEKSFHALPSINLKEYNTSTEGLKKYFGGAGIFYEAPSKNPIYWIAQKVAGPLGRGEREKKAKHFFEGSSQKEISESTGVLDKDSNLSLEYLGHYLKAHKSMVAEKTDGLRNTLAGVEKNYQENLSTLEKMYGFKDKGYFVDKLKSKFKKESPEVKRKRDIFEAKRRVLKEAHSVEKNKLNEMISSVAGSDADSFERDYSKMIDFFIKTEGTLANSEVWEHRYEQTLGGSENLRKIKEKKAFS